VWIENVSRDDVQLGRHRFPGLDNSMLIQIGDPCGEFPTPLHQFGEIHRFEFLDLEKHEMSEADEFKITQEQAEQLVALLARAVCGEMNVVAHCTAGVCRSGAVADVAVEYFGFEDAGAYRSPNLLVKHRMLKALGISFDADETHYAYHYGEPIPYVGNDGSGNLVVYPPKNK
jgi:hypothetical protein